MDAHPWRLALAPGYKTAVLGLKFFLSGATRDVVRAAHGAPRRVRTQGCPLTSNIVRTMHNVLSRSVS